MLLFWMILFELEFFYWVRIWKVLAIAFISGLVCVGKTGVTELYREFEWSTLDIKATMLVTCLRSSQMLLNFIIGFFALLKTLV